MRTITISVEPNKLQAKLEEVSKPNSQGQLRNILCSGIGLNDEMQTRGFIKMTCPTKIKGLSK